MSYIQDNDAFSITSIIGLGYPGQNASDLPGTTQWFVHSYERASSANATE